MASLPSFLCLFVDSNDWINLSSTFTPEYLTKQEMENVLIEFKTYKKDLLDSYDNNTYNQKDVDEILKTKDKISLINNAIKNYYKEKESKEICNDLIKKIDEYNSSVEKLLKNKS